MNATKADTALSAVLRYIAGFNSGDVHAMSEMFDSPGAVIDGMPPHLWLGPSAVQDWYRDVMTESAHLGASDYRVSVGEPLHNSVAGDHAYLVLPATMDFALNGARVTQADAFFTVALRRADGAWRIAAWAWTKGRQPQ